MSNILKIEAIAYVAKALRDGLILKTDEMTAGPNHEAVDGGPKFALYLDKPRRGKLRSPPEAYKFYDPRDAGVIIESYYGRGDTRKLVERAYEKAGMRVPSYEIIRAKKKRRK